VSTLEVADLKKRFGKEIALDGISFEVSEGEIVSILGPSGCGKSTILMIIAGLEVPDEGDVLWKGISILDVPPHRRGFGLMFQDYALFPHMNVEANVKFGLMYSNMSKENIQKHVSDILKTVELSGFEKRDINTLSGGEQQRVALARSLAPNPQLIMLDEPLKSIDRSLREHLLTEINQILHKLHMTAIYVTHDQQEAFSISDRIVLMRDGAVEQIGTAQEIYRKPSSLFVAKFLGFSNFLTGKISKSNGKSVIKTPIGDLQSQHEKSGDVIVLIRPDTATIGSQYPFHIAGEVIETSFRGNIIRVVLSVDSQLNHNQIKLSFEFDSNIQIPNVGEQIVVSFEIYNTIHLFQEL
jgi:ABC-type Fe3+/spermidine/putrescine transport system ATPase subunit